MIRSYHWAALVATPSNPTGTLVPLEIRWIPAPQAARVESVDVQPGAAVEPETILLRLTNPEIDQSANDARLTDGRSPCQRKTVVRDVKYSLIQIAKSRSADRPLIRRLPGVRLVDAQRLDGFSPPGTRLDVRSYLTLGFPYRRAHAAALAELLVRLLAPPAPKKALITDLDDTLWGGIVGEDGWEKLNLGGHDPIGEAFLDFQRALKSLSRQGVLLGIVSKNDEAVALEAFRRHPEMALRVEDFAGRRINWEDKAKNIVET